MLGAALSLYTPLLEHVSHSDDKVLLPWLDRDLSGLGLSLIRLCVSIHHLSIHSGNIYSAPLLGTRDTTTNRIGKHPCPRGTHILGRVDTLGDIKYVGGGGA